jgi:hypothetical protein
MHSWSSACAAYNDLAESLARTNPRRSGDDTVTQPR